MFLLGRDRRDRWINTIAFVQGIAAVKTFGQGHVEEIAARFRRLGLLVGRGGVRLSGGTPAGFDRRRPSDVTTAEMPTASTL